MCSATGYPVLEWPAYPLTDLREIGILQSYQSDGDRMQFDRLKRRDFITLMGCSVAAWPLKVRAQQLDSVQRVSVLMGPAESDPEAQSEVAAFRQGFRIEWRSDVLWA